MNKSSYICLGLLVLASMIGVGHAISCLAYSHSGISDLRGTPTVVECGSAVTTCSKTNYKMYYTASSFTFKSNSSVTVYYGSCGVCSPSLPSSYTCTTCSTDQCNSAFAAVRAAAPLTLALPLLMAAALRSF
ncbi:hypothetical protein BOX15_Mlig027435g1 [Macrostomum lignano]|uniref:UPAR/Ly6 domain-containing protein n=1 Tax=Macrostomum lignano TaxID=282301 RepID=A0A267F499_9PLAT|nr:hypothetical protein BOX15_Mlig027435g1 [Macrostomum lignano]